MAPDAQLEEARKALDLARKNTDAARHDRDIASQHRADCLDMLCSANAVEQRALAARDAIWNRYKLLSLPCQFGATSPEAEQELAKILSSHRTAKRKHLRKKAKFSSVRKEYTAAKARHRQAERQYKQAQSDLALAIIAFRQRLEIARVEMRRNTEENRILAELAGVPPEYLDELKVVTRPDGRAHIYFGGVDLPDGPGHGHYVLRPNGDILYTRDPAPQHEANGSSCPSALQPAATV